MKPLVAAMLAYIPTIDRYDQGEIASNTPSGSGTATLRMRYAPPYNSPGRFYFASVTHITN
jgi:hypothetical protein